MDFHERLKDAILQGEWAVGQQLPSIRKMMVREGLSHHTVVSAYTRLWVRACWRPCKGAVILWPAGPV